MKGTVLGRKKLGSRSMVLKIVCFPHLITFLLEFAVDLHVIVVFLLRTRLPFLMISFNLSA